jgi:hypothetical protein
MQIHGLNSQQLCILILRESGHFLAGLAPSYFISNYLSQVPTISTDLLACISISGIIILVMYGRYHN